MRSKYNIKLIIILTLIMVMSYVLDKTFVTKYIYVEADSELASTSDAIPATFGDAVVEGEAVPFEMTGDRSMDDLDVASSSQTPTLVFGATAVVNKSVGSKHPMENSATWWSNAKSYITSTFGVVDGQYNNSSTAPNANGVWCAGLVSRVIHNTYPGGSAIAVTESVDTLYSEMQSSGLFEFISEGYVADFADIVEKTKAGDIMLLMSKESNGSWKWTHTNLITYYGYIYSQGGDGKIRMNTFDNYNEYGAYDANVSAGYYYYIYRPKSSSYIGIRKIGNMTGRAFDNVWFEAYDSSGTYLGAYMTGCSSDEKGGYAYYLRKSTSDTSYVDGSAGSVPLPVGSTVYLYEQGVRTGNGYTLPAEAASYAGTKGSTWSYVRGPQKQYYVTVKTVDYSHWTAANAVQVLETESTYGPLSLKKSTASAYSLYTQDANRYSLAGAKYTVASSSNRFVYYLETDASGTAYLLDANGSRTSSSKITGLPADTYYCWETSPSKGYQLDANCNVNKKKSVVLGSGNTSGSFTSEEVPSVALRGGIQLIKRSEEDFTRGNQNYSLSAEYTVYSSSGTEVGRIRTNEAGYGYLGGLAAGTYTVKETSPGAGYELDDSAYTVVVSTASIGKYIYEGVDYSAVFEPGYYRNRYSDLAGMSDAALLQHFATKGLSEGRRASYIYDAGYYAQQKGMSCYDAFKYYLGYGMYQNELTADYDEIDEQEAGVYYSNTYRPIVLSYESPKAYEMGINLEKLDRLTGSSIVEGEAALDGAEYSISFYPHTSSDIEGLQESIEDEAPARSWVIVTRRDEDGHYRAHFTEEYLSQERESDDFYIDQNGNIIIPYGIIIIEEISAPKGYKLSEISYQDEELDEPLYIQLNDGTFDGDISVGETIIRGDIKLEKRSYVDDTSMAGVEFEIRSVQTGEALTIVTDENGYASTSGMWMSCTEDGSEVEQVEGYGALPYGRYIVTELRCAANENKQLEPAIEVMIEDEVIYDAYDPSNNEPIIRNVPLPELGTTARVGASELDEIPIGEEVTLVDTVAYSYLRAGTEYTLMGKLMLRDASGRVTELKQDGRAVTATTHFTTSDDYEKSIYEKSGLVEVSFEPIDYSEMAGESVVIYEYLYLGDGVDEDNEYPGYEDDDIFPVRHESPDDEGQTLHIIEIGTTASEGSDTSDNKTTIIDKVSYSNVIVGETYYIEGCLVDKKSGEIVKVGDEEVRASASFQAESTDGVTEVVFTFDGDSLDISDVVVFERMLNADGKLVASHEDIEDEAQSVTLSRSLVSGASTSVKTSDEIKIWLLLVLIIMSGIGSIVAISLVYRRRR